MPASRWPYLDHAGVLAIAHRGASGGDIPENSMEAFAHARALGCSHLETDVHATRDGVLVAFHDARLDRLTDGTGAIAERDWADLAGVRIAGRAAIPRLEEVLSTWPDARVNIDTKSERAAALLPTVLTRLGAVERVCVGSFSDARIASVRRALGPSLCTSMGPRAVARLFFGRYGLPQGRPAAACVQIPEYWHGIRLAAPGLVARAHDLGLQVHVWTINEPEAMRRLLDIGVDGIVTDRIDVLRKILAEPRRNPAGGAAK